MSNNKEWHLGDIKNSKNIAVLEILKEYVPSYAKHMFSSNMVLQAFYMSDKGGINPLNMPICKVCARPGVGVDDPSFKGPSFKLNELTGEVTKRINCYCDLHGATYDTKDLRSYLIEDLGMNPKIVFQMEVILYGSIENFKRGLE